MEKATAVIGDEDPHLVVHPRGGELDVAGGRVEAVEHRVRHGFGDGEAERVELCPLNPPARANSTTALRARGMLAEIAG